VSSGTPPVVGVELLEEETVVDRGTRRVTWFVKRADVWEHASRWPAVASAELDAGPGTVWRRQLVLQLPTQTELMRVETRPAPPRRRDAFEYLRAEVRNAPRQVRRTYYRVAPRGALTRLPT
jgi:hypothetical protein